MSDRDGGGQLRQQGLVLLPLGKLGNDILLSEAPRRRRGRRGQDMKCHGRKRGQGRREAIAGGETRAGEAMTGGEARAGEAIAGVEARAGKAIAGGEAGAGKAMAGKEARAEQAMAGGEAMA